jgi:prepilin-type N-terminal cleavage/methylation domain-containing protein
MRNTMKIFKGGFTLIEILVVLAIIVLIALVILPPFSSIRENQTLNNTVENVVSALNRARSQTLASLDSSEYGVRFEPEQVIIFKGKVYSSGAPGNEISPLSAPAGISNVTLGGVSGPTGELFFERLSGVPSAAGTIMVSTPSEFRSITISATGAITKD